MSKQGKRQRRRTRVLLVAATDEEWERLLELLPAQPIERAGSIIEALEVSRSRREGR